MTESLVQKGEKLPPEVVHSRAGSLIQRFNEEFNPDNNARIDDLCLYLPNGEIL